MEGRRIETQPEYRLYLPTLGANVEECHKWNRGISKSVKELQVVGRPTETIEVKQATLPSEPTIE